MSNKKKETNNFVKRKGTKDENNDIKMSKLNISLKEKDANFLIKIIVNEVLKVASPVSVAAKCLRYYLAYPLRISNQKYKAGQLLGLSKGKLYDICKKIYPEPRDYLSFIGYSFWKRGDLNIHIDIVKNYLINNVRWAHNNNIPKEKILSFYSYREVKNFFRDKDRTNKAAATDLYYAIGDGNHLFGKVHTIDMKRRRFQILLVLFDEYNWDNSATYFMKIKKNTNDPYLLSVETKWFKELERKQLAKPFITFFIDPITVSY